MLYRVWTLRSLPLQPRLNTSVRFGKDASIPGQDTSVLREKTLRSLTQDIPPPRRLYSYIKDYNIAKRKLFDCLGTFLLTNIKVIRIDLEIAKCKKNTPFNKRDKIIMCYFMCDLCVTALNKLQTQNQKYENVLKMKYIIVNLLKC